MNFSDLIHGTTQIITGAKPVDGQTPNTVTIGEARGAAIVVALATLVGASVYTRKRVAEGKEPVAGYIL